MNAIGNLIWLLFGGVIIAIEYIIASFLLMITVVGFPFGIQTLKLAGLAFWPFGREVITHQRADGCLSVLMNILWILIGGFWIAITHLFFGLLLAITVVGLPFAQQHLKLAALALTPFGKDVN